LYRTAQEALSNIRTHAPTAVVRVRLCWQHDEVVLEVDDTGHPVTVGGAPRPRRRVAPDTD
jgi:signal transduction histidine kinase